jgi:hypothetical protein
MNKDTYINTADKDCAYILKKIIEQSVIKKKLNYKKHDLTEAYYKTLLPIFFSTKIINLYKKIKNKEIKYKLTIQVSSLEEKLLISELLKKFKINKLIFINFNDFFYNFKRIIFKTIYLIIEIFLEEKKFYHFNKYNNEILCFLNNKAEKNSYFDYYKKTKIKINYFNLNKKFLFKKIAIFKLNFNYKKNYINSDFLSIYKLYIKFFFIKNIINFYNPKIISFFEGDSDINGMINAIAKRYKITSICLQWGAFMTPPYPKAGFRMLNSNYLFTWGKYYKHQFRKFNKKIKILIVGNPTLKTNKYKKNSKKISIFCSRESFNIKEEDRLNLLKLTLWIKNYLQDYSITVRSHPYDKSKFYFQKFDNKIQTHNPSKVPIQDTINSSEIMITNMSGSVVEAGRLGTIPLLLNSNKIIFEKNIEEIRKFKDIKLIGTFEEIKKTLIYLTQNSKARNEIKKKIQTSFNDNIKYIDITAQNIIKKEIFNIFSK